MVSNSSLQQQHSNSQSSQTQTNPLLNFKVLPAFGLIKASHVEPAIMTLLERSYKKLDEVEKLIPSWTIIHALNKIERDFQRTFAPITHLLGVANSKELREAFEKIQPKIVEFSLRASQSKIIYKSLQHLYDTNNDLNTRQKRILELRLREARHSGIALKEKEQKRFNEIAHRLAELSTHFSNNVLDATKAFYIDIDKEEDIAGLSVRQRELAHHKYRQSHPEQESAHPEKGPWRIGLDLPSYLPFMQYAENRDLRKKLYFAQIQKASSGEFNNTPLIADILELRHELAQLLGFDNYASLSLDNRMANSFDKIDYLQESIRDAAWPKAQEELKDLKKQAEKYGQKDFSHWDVAYFTEKLRKERFDFSEEDVRPYFPFEKALEGLFSLAHDIFGIQIEKGDIQAFSDSENSQQNTLLWDKQVRFYEIFEQNKSSQNENTDDPQSRHKIAAFYLDPYARPENKRGGAWMDECVQRSKLNGNLELPVAYLICNGTPPLPKQDSLMNFEELRTLFHEFGHCLQHMLTKIDEPDLAGINHVEWDAVELPSQFMEQWCYHHPTVQKLSSHFETGEALPDELFQKIIETKTFMTGTQNLRQLRFSFLDMELHKNNRKSKEDIPEFIDRIKEQATNHLSILPPLKEEQFLCSFSHIFAGGYAAGYYSYKWAEVLSSDCFAAFEETDLEDYKALSLVGGKFRNTILAKGGSQKASEIFQEFRGREPKIDALLRHTGLQSQTPAELKT